MLKKRRIVVKYSVPKWLGMTKEEFDKKAKPGTCVVCGKVAINKHHNLCKGHHSAYHRWKNLRTKMAGKKPRVKWICTVRYCGNNPPRFSPRPSGKCSTLYHCRNVRCESSTER